MKIEEIAFSARTKMRTFDNQKICLVYFPMMYNKVSENISVAENN